jgi:glycine/D-amino acid oxidase-like deaminating enzyme
MTPAPEFPVGGRVTVFGATGLVVGVVDESLAPEDLPDVERLAEDMGLRLPHRAPVDLARVGLRQMGVDRLLLIRYLHSGKEVFFFALHSAFDDRWRDMRGKELEVKAYVEDAN